MREPALPEPPSSAEVAGESEGAVQPEQPRRWPIVVAATLMGFVLIGVTVLMAWAFAGPVSCPDGAFESTRFGYCVTVPQGWRALASQSDDQPFDLFQAQGEGATITVTALPLDPGEDLAGFAHAMAELDASGGYEATDPREVRVAGELAVQIELSPARDVRLDPTLGREVVFIRDGVGWRVQMGETPDRFDDTAAALDAMLAGWVFV